MVHSLAGTIVRKYIMATSPISLTVVFVPHFVFWYQRFLVLGRESQYFIDSVYVRELMDSDTLVGTCPPSECGSESTAFKNLILVYSLVPLIIKLARSLRSVCMLLANCLCW